MSDENDISRIREEESERGRRPKHSSEKEKLRRLKSMMLTAIRRGNLGLFQQVLIELGQQPGSSEYETSMKLYEEYQLEKRR
jgi:hypothetical protein